MANSVGEIALDLVVNRNGFDRQMSSLTNIAKKAGAVIAGAFAVDKLVDFGKSCLDLGSDLSEVQNVVDVTFQTMSDKVDKFARSAAGNFGLSETMAKKFTGTFGSMADAFGFSEKEAYKMSTALTGLAGDVASFYNISQDEAYTKLKSVFTGETETLKDLGVVMTQSALDAYALANGYGKTTAKMTEAEKVSLRFAFVQEKLSNASGDFARTSGSWANQVRILSLQFDSLKASIGQGLINVFTPVIKWINILLAKVSVAASKFKEFTELITGKKSEGSSGATGASSAAETADSMSSASDSAKSTADSTGKTAKNLKKASKFLAGFDKITKMNEKDSSSGSGGSSGAGAGVGNGIKAKVDTSDLDKTSKKLDKLKNAFLALKKRFVKGFKIGLGDTSVLDSIKNNMKSIVKSIRDIASDKEVQGALGDMFLRLAESAGKIAGSFASIGLTIADNLTGGISKYLEQNTGRIKKYLISMFDITAEIADIRADFMVAVADIFTVFRSGDAKQITADFIKIFADAFMGVTELLAKFERDLEKGITQPITKNSEKIKTALSKTLKPIKNIIGTIATTVEKTMDKINQVYDDKINPALQGITDGITAVTGTLLDNYNQYVAPVIDSLTKEFSKMWDSCVQPALNKAADLVGNIASCISAFWENILAPLVQWIIDTIIPVVMPIVKQIGKAVIKVLGNIAKRIGSAIDVFNGLLEFLTGVFTGDWKKVWNGVKKIFKSFKDWIANVIKTLLSLFQLQFVNIKNAVLTPFKLIKKTGSDIWNGLKNKVVEIVGTLKSKSSDKVKELKKSFVDTFSSIKKKVTSIFSDLWEKGIKGTINAILSGVETMANGVIKAFNNMINSINNLGFKMPGWLPKKWANKELGFNIKTLPEINIPKLATGAYVKANTPQLAMIGDNRHQGEVVAPEGKLYEVTAQVLKDFAKQNRSQVGQAQQDRDINLTLELVLGEQKFRSEVIKAVNKDKRLNGKTTIKFK